ncbi:MAG TPA: ankyrin repeat domain-containing protein [Gammaproteobacteria bacterium]|nr:ankyrin repeat domain-containing protein [Gammaproteobacteria bacterium]
MADLNKRIGPNGETRLHLAAKANDTLNVVALLEAKADPNIADNQQKMPLAFANEGGCFETLLANGADPNRVSMTYQEPNPHANPYGRPPQWTIECTLPLPAYAMKFNKPLLATIHKHYKPTR